MEPLWRITSRVLMAPPGSSTLSVKTEKVLPVKESLEEMSLALVELFFLLVVDWGLGALGFFVVAAIQLRYHPASRVGWWASNGMHGNVRLKSDLRMCAGAVVLCW